MKIVADVAGTCLAIAIGYYAIASWTALRFAIRSSDAAPAAPTIAPLVAIIKPLHGLTDDLRANIISYLELDYPRVEYYFGVKDERDRAAEVVTALRDCYPQKKIALVVGGAPGCSNRKVGKLIAMAERASDADIFVMSDADIAVDRDHLRRLVGDLTAEEKTGVVSCLYRARPGGPLASRLEALAVNTDFTPMVMLSAAVEPIRYALGATIAIKRAALEQIGGFRAIKDYLADDFHLGKLAADHNWDVVLSNSMVTTVTREQTFADFWSHQLRWARTYRTTRPVSLATIATHGPFWGLILLIASRGSHLVIASVISMLAMRLAMSALMLRKVLKVPELIRDLWLVPLKDLCMTGIWFQSLLGNRVEWAGRRLEILANGAIREVDG